MPYVMTAAPVQSGTPEPEPEPVEAAAGATFEAGARLPSRRESALPIFIGTVVAATAISLALYYGNRPA